MKAKEWEETMTQEEVDWLNSVFGEILSQTEENSYRVYNNCDNFRAARIWISSQRRRFNKQEDRGCCGSYRDVVSRWNDVKKREDLYLIGFNYGH